MGSDGFEAGCGRFTEAPRGGGASVARAVGGSIADRGMSVLTVAAGTSAVANAGGATGPVFDVDSGGSDRWTIRCGTIAVAAARLSATA